MKALYDGLFKQNPVFILLLGLVPAVAIATTGKNGLSLGLIAAIIMLISAALNYVLQPLMPRNVRAIITSLIVIVLVVLSHSLLLSWNPQIVASLGIFLPLLAANSLVLQQNSTEKSFSHLMLQSLGQGLGFCLALTLIGIIREFLGLGAIFGTQILKGSLAPFSLASGAPGGLIIVGLLLAVVNKLTGRGGELHD